MVSVYGDHPYDDDGSINSHVKRLRKKFKMVDRNFARIQTVYSVGYRFCDTPELAPAG